MTNTATGLLLSTTFLAMTAALPARADTWLAFGDSLTDTGNAFALTGGALPDPAFYHDGRFSNGALWFDRIATDHGLLADHLLGAADPGQRDWNFAVAGATTGTDPLDPATGTPPGLRSQVAMARALADAGQVAIGTDTTAILWAGANDHGLWLTDPARVASQDAAVARTVAANIGTAARDIADAGAGRIAVVNLFDFSLAPTTATLPADLRDAGDRMVTQHNAQLIAEAQSATAATGAQVLVVDVHSLFADISSDPAAWGFETLAPCLPDGGAPVCASPAEADGHVFWDGTHLTTAAQMLVAETVIGTLVAGTDVPALSTETTVLSFALADRHLQDARLRIAEGAPGIWVEAQHFGLMAGDQTGQFNGIAAGWGGDMAGLRWGGSFAWSEGDTTSDGRGIGGDSWTVSSFARFDTGPFGLTAQLGWGESAFDLSRDTAYAPAPRAAGQTDAQARILDLSADYSLRTGPLAITMEGGLTWAETLRDGWTETGAGLMGARVADMTQRTLSTRLAATTSYDLHLAGLPVTTYATATWRHRVAADARGGEVTLNSGQVIAPDEGYGFTEGIEAEIGIATRIGDMVSARASYTTDSLSDDFSDGVLSASIAVSF